jgi:hypothetical protein
VPLHPTTMEALRTHAHHRDAAHPRPRSPSFVLTICGTRPHVQRFRRAATTLRWSGLPLSRWPAGTGSTVPPRQPWP